MEQYRAKDLVYIDGKAYRKEDLKDMIQYYQQHYKPDIQLPSTWHTDVSGQVFKHYPFYPAISKQTYRPNLFYDEYCNLDITFKEFLDFLVQEEPDQCELLMINQYTNIQTRLGSVYKQDTQYSYSDHVIDVEEGINTSDEYTDTLNNIIEFIINEYKDSHQLWYDVKTVESIYRRRTQCQTYNKLYSKNMTNRYLDQLIISVPKIININTFITYYSIYLFILYQINLYQDMGNQIQTLIDVFGDLFELDVPNTATIDQFVKDYPIDNMLDQLRQLI